MNAKHFLLIATTLLAFLWQITFENNPVFAQAPAQSVYDFRNPYAAAALLRAFTPSNREGHRKAWQSDRCRPREDSRRIQIRSDPVGLVIAARVLSAKSSEKISLARLLKEFRS
jgi:hypothetical protein